MSDWQDFLWQIATARSEVELRDRFIEDAGKFFMANAWGFDRINANSEVISAEFRGLSQSFCDRYHQLGRQGDQISLTAIQEKTPIHNLSIQTQESWQQTDIYQKVFHPAGIENGMASVLVGNGNLVGGIYFLREQGLSPFANQDLLRIGTLSLHLSVRMAELRNAHSEKLNCLTMREREVAELVAKGFNNREIGDRIGISREGVKQALKRMFRKLDVSARAEMVAILKI
ncbi:helix-turn-helix transcriptional regulator [Pseudanabaena galeata UHCC 0370]|uniref:Helix-turn-helix transcriptional regulator n=1 Tax=Pseudanabaena galeata UHCC 0370 TaxID=3110310 RepID=A0ABU5TSX4_9CYAN|nr:helix-turn-helix transcriptional regulator [Pseudanabaena galeata]MEA5480583.1 helix-turn-helix transcriptional regulator [Pseudanabaena galeata UHCC 0370]